MNRQRTRRYETRWSVKLYDRLARVFITIGGVGTILAISAVCLFLVSVVIPLFLPGSAREEGVGPAPVGPAPIHMAVDEYRVAAWTLDRAGRVLAFRLDNGEPLDTLTVSDQALTAWSFDLQTSGVCLGYANGSVQLGHIGYRADFAPAGELPAAAQRLDTGEALTVGASLVQKIAAGQFRRQRLVAEMEPPVQIDESGAPIVLVDHVRRDSGPMIVAYTSDGRLFSNRVRRFENLMTGEIETEVARTELPSPRRTGASDAQPAFLYVSESGAYVYVAWHDGQLYRYNARSQNTGVAERASLVGARQERLTAADMLLGGTSIIAGDSRGTTSVYFPINDPEARTSDGTALVRSHELARDGARVTALGPSPRSRAVAVGYGDGVVRIYHATNGGKLVEVHVEGGKSVDLVAVAPKNDGLVALSGGSIAHWDLDLRHPEATLSALFLPVWYEGYQEPEHVWQSSSGTDDFEPKFGLWPLVFGTLKATFYSMLFGVPLALLAAVFSSEFLAPAFRVRVKTLIEFMASLPSVVLGFLAALVFAPFVQRVVPTTLVGFLTVPGAFVIAAYLWQMLPHQTALRLERYRMIVLLLTLPVGMALAVALGPVFESALFAGDFRLWLDGAYGSGTGGWFFILLPLCALLVAVLLSQRLGPWFRRHTADMPRPAVGMWDALRFTVGAAAAVLLAVIVAWFLTEVGLDPRGSGGFLGTYVQRNALIVGFIMGFAIIPIIYTIAEDALTAVPEHLRAASLGAGATPWQTAVRIVIPAAMSGLFSAIMIGLGRAVGETMIVLMAAGNTPVLDMNIFNGFRTLSANIAVELPEAVRNSTHYRTLFFAALILFTMTFIINTVAELVRLRFRKRASQL